MEGIGIYADCVLLCVAIPLIGLILLSNYAIEAIVRSWGSAGRRIRVAWLVLTLLLNATVTWFVISLWGPFD
jgi:hypothetical protein